MEEDDVKELLRRVEEALAGVTTGPWYVWEDPDSHIAEDATIATIPYETMITKPDSKAQSFEVLGCSEWLRCKPEDLRFMAAARTLVPELMQALGRFSKK
jgi:hypothetical protein